MLSPCFQLFLVAIHLFKFLKRTYKPHSTTIYLFDNLFASFGIRDQACLISLSHPSRWLIAIPQVSLCLGQNCSWNMFMVRCFFYFHSFLCVLVFQLLIPLVIRGRALLKFITFNCIFSVAKVQIPN